MRKLYDSVRKSKHLAHATEDHVQFDKEKWTKKKTNVPYQEPHTPMFIDKANNATQIRNNARSAQRLWRKKSEEEIKAKPKKKKRKVVWSHD